MRAMRLHAVLFAVFLAAPALVAQSPAIRIHAATLLDGSGKSLRNATVVVQGSKITSVETGNAANPTYNLGSLTILPGLIDVHAHVGWHFDQNGRYAGRPGTPAQEILYAAENAYVTLRAGFTTIQSPGQANDVELRDAIARGVLPGPRILTSIRQLNEGSGTAEEIRQKVRQLKADGADVIKIFASASIRDGGKQTMTDAQLQAACGEAKAIGIRTMVHAHSTESVKATVNAGCDQVEHGALIDQEALTLMAAKGVYFDPNIGVVLQNYLTNKAKFLGIGNYNEEGFRYLEKGLPVGNDTFKRALRKKVKMVFGTDAMPGALGRQYEELIYRVQDGGQDPMDAITTITSKAAESIGLGATIGAIAPGMEADIIATAGNPVMDITAVRRPVFVMKGGKVYKNVMPATARSTGATSSSKR
jgi:imidazolonepropionase-like amidohydrolase